MKSSCRSDARFQIHGVDRHPRRPERGASPRRLLPIALFGALALLGSACSQSVKPAASRASTTVTTADLTAPAPSTSTAAPQATIGTTSPVDSTTSTPAATATSTVTTERPTTVGSSAPTTTRPTAPIPTTTGPSTTKAVQPKTSVPVEWSITASELAAGEIGLAQFSGSEDFTPPNGSGVTLPCSEASPFAAARLASRGQVIGINRLVILGSKLGVLPSQSTAWAATALDRKNCTLRHTDGTDEKVIGVIHTPDPDNKLDMWSVAYVVTQQGVDVNGVDLYVQKGALLGVITY
jgi:hypothetical protein